MALMSVATLFYSLYDQYLASIWRWKNSTTGEIACRSNNSLLVDSIGGAPNSKHLKGKAFDISPDGHDHSILVELARKSGFRGIGDYNALFDVYTGPKISWDLHKILEAGAWWARSSDNARAN